MAFIKDVSWKDGAVNYRLLCEGLKSLGNICSAFNEMTKVCAENIYKLFRDFESSVHISMMAVGVAAALPCRQ